MAMPEPPSLYRPQSYHHAPSGPSTPIERDRFAPLSRRSPPVGPQSFHHNTPSSYHQPRVVSPASYPPQRPHNRTPTESGPPQKLERRSDSVPSGPSHAIASTAALERKPSLPDSTAFPAASAPIPASGGPNGPGRVELKRIAAISSLATPVTESSEHASEDYFSSKPVPIVKNEQPAKEPTSAAEVPPSPLPTAHKAQTMAPELKPEVIVEHTPEPTPVSTPPSIIQRQPTVNSLPSEDEDEEDGLNESDVIAKMADLDTQIATLESRLTELQQEKSAEQEFLLQRVATPAATPSPEPESFPHVSNMRADTDRRHVKSETPDDAEPMAITYDSDSIFTSTLPEKILMLNRDMASHAHEAVDMKYKLSNPVKAISDYDFYARNESSYKVMRPIILKHLQARRKEEYEKGRQLQIEYKELYDRWLVACRALDEEIAVSSSKAKGKDAATSSTDGNFDDDDDEAGVFRRPSRGHHNADTVRSEAEFMEVLASLEWEDSRDPKNRAKLTSARIPNMIIDEVERSTVYADSNNIVKNPNIPLKRLFTDGVDVFTEEEHRRFCEGYKLRPKQFGFIANHMGNIRTFEECVLHYYRTKKTVDYKTMATASRRRGAGGRKGRRRARGGAKAKPRQALLDGPTVDGEDAEKDQAAETTDDQPTPQPPAQARQHWHRERMPDEEIAALLELGSTGRPRRAAAPVFGGPGGGEKREQPAVEQLQPKPKRVRGGKKSIGKGRGSGAATIPPLEEPQILPRAQMPLYQTPQMQFVATTQIPTEPGQIPIKQEPAQYYQLEQSQPPQAIVQQGMANLVGVPNDLKDREVDAISALAGLFGGMDGIVPQQQSPHQTPHLQPHELPPQLQLQEQQYAQAQGLLEFQPQRQPQDGQYQQPLAQRREPVRILPALEPKPSQQQVEDTSALGFLSSAAATATIAPTAASTPSQPSETEQSEQEQQNDDQSKAMSGSGQLKRNNMISSYWSVHEMDLFPKLLQSYGTQWEEVSKHLKAKTTTMVWYSSYLAALGSC
ncbi:hypothetical protein V1517DRAFT_257366 [Lipomyces orientalis]|uniref:Uncharacterized protein n=1 Tax=Lipomyces orientalis TaxID=1233043 RepID=A0ACC3TT36_9ASCO